MGILVLDVGIILPTAHSSPLLFFLLFSSVSSLSFPIEEMGRMEAGISTGKGGTFGTLSKASKSFQSALC